MKIWRRYVLFRLTKSFLFILTAIFSLFVFVDLATRGGKILSKMSPLSLETLLHYVYQFSNYLHLFCGLAFLLATIQVLLDLNAHYELVALQMGGLCRKKILSPFFTLASLLFFLLLANYEWVYPKASSEASEYIKTYARHKKKSAREHLQTLSLSDGSQLVFQYFDPKKRELFDIFWLKNDSTFWHMKFFHIDTCAAKYIDCFERVEGKWQNVRRLLETTIDIDAKKALEAFVPHEKRALSTLIKEAYSYKNERNKSLSHLFYKLTSPLLLFFSLFALAPVCFAFSRELSAFKILSCALFGFLAMMMILDGLLVLGENQVLPAIFAFGPPLLILFGVLSRPFIRWKK